MKGEKHKNTPQMYKQNLLEPLKTWLERAKQTLKSGILGSKSGFGGVKIMSWQAIQKGKMVQNAGFVLKNRQNKMLENSGFLPTF